MRKEIRGSDINSFESILHDCAVAMASGLYAVAVYAGSWCGAEAACERCIATLIEHVQEIERMDMAGEISVGGC
jgi:hypothetical protein